MDISPAIVLSILFVIAAGSVVDSAGYKLSYLELLLKYNKLGN